jgi:bacterioferritin
MTESLVLDVDRIRREAHQTMAAGPVTGHYGLDAERVLSVLNDVVATEVVGWLRSTSVALTAERMNRPEVAAHFTAHADQEMQHAVAVAELIAGLGGRPNFDPDTLAQRTRTDYPVRDEAALRGLVDQNLRASRIVLASYREIADWLGERDPDTGRLIGTLLADEEANAAALERLLAD